MPWRRTMAPPWFRWGELCWTDQTIVGSLHDVTVLGDDVEGHPLLIALPGASLTPVDGAPMTFFTSSGHGGRSRQWEQPRPRTTVEWHPPVVALEDTSLPCPRNLWEYVWPALEQGLLHWCWSHVWSWWSFPSQCGCEHGHVVSDQEDQPAAASLMESSHGNRFRDTILEDALALRSGTCLLQAVNPLRLWRM